jgi:hypothetical protein
MNGKSSALPFVPEGAKQGSASWLALAIALGAGVGAFAAPALSLLVLAALAAHALMRAETIRFQPLRLAGPIFAALIVGAFTGLAGGIGVLFVWRMFADTRWSVSEAQRLALAAGRPGETSWRALAHAWATPLFGLTLVAYTAPHMIAGLPLDLPHVPIWVPLVGGALAVGAVVDWALQRAADWRLGELAAAPATHLLAHHALFILAFGLMIDVSAGIVALAAWRLAHAAPLRQASLTAVP